MVKTIAFSQRVYFHTLPEEDAMAIKHDLNTFNSMIHATYKKLLHHEITHSTFQKDEWVKQLSQRYNTDYYFPWNAFTQAKLALQLNLEINQKIKTIRTRQIQTIQRQLDHNNKQLTSLLNLKKDLINFCKTMKEQSQAKMPQIKHPYFTTHEMTLQNLYLYEVNILTPDIRRLRNENKGLKSRMNNLNMQLMNAIHHIKPLRFGSYQMMKAQHIQNHERWLNQYRLKRNKNLIIAGTKNKPFANALFKYDTQNEEMSYLTHNHTPIKFKLTFQYQAAMLKQKLSLPSATLNKNIAYHLENHGSYFIIKAIFEREIDQRFVYSDRAQGVIGLDINVKHFAMVETNRQGNLIGVRKIRYDLHNKTKNQRLHIIREKAKEIMRICESTHKVLVLENLDFSQIKIYKRYIYNKKQRQMLNEFAYQSIITAIISRSMKVNIRTYQVNPAYTSFIGNLKYKKIKGLDDHLSAAYVIARKGMGFKEKISKQFQNLLTDTQKQLPFSGQWRELYMIFNSRISY